MNRFFLFASCATIITLEEIRIFGVMKNKDVGIITFHRAENYGASLQAYALLQTVSDLLKNDLRNVEIIDYRAKSIEAPYKVFYFGNDGRVFYNLAKSVFLMPQNLLRRYRFSKYRKKYLCMSQSISKEQMPEAFKKYGSIITGSDQVWNLAITKDDSCAYLIEIKDTSLEKISYAASIGTDTCDSEYLRKIAMAINDYKSISVREKNARDMLSEYVASQIEICLDPVLLLGMNAWKRAFKGKVRVKKPYLLVYTINNDTNMVEYAKEIAQRENLLIVHVDKKNRFGRLGISRYCSGPDSFVNLVSDSKYVITNSFHGLAFALIFHKEFCVFPSKGKNARIEGLIAMCGLDCRKVINGSLAYVKEDDDYSNIASALDDYRNQSINYLRSALGLGLLNDQTSIFE